MIEIKGVCSTQTTELNMLLLHSSANNRKSDYRRWGNIVRSIRGGADEVQILAKSIPCVSDINDIRVSGHTIYMCLPYYGVMVVANQSLVFCRVHQQISTLDRPHVSHVPASSL
jgi:hypothetical protein